MKINNIEVSVMFDLCVNGILNNINYVYYYFVMFQCLI